MENENTNRFAVDEISITQIIDDIRSQWKVVIGTALLFLVLAAVYTIGRTDMYRYTMNIELGQKPRPGLSKSANFILVPPARLTLPGFEAAHVVMAQLEDAWLPQSVYETLEKDGELVFAPDFEVSNPEDDDHRDTLLLRVTTLAPDRYHQEITKGLANAGAKLVSNHSAFLAKKMEDRIRRKDRLEKGKDNLQRQLEAHKGRVEKLQKIIDVGGNSALAAGIELNSVLPEKIEIERQLHEVMGSITKLESEAAVLEAAVKEFDVSYIDKDVLRKQKLAAADVMESVGIMPTRVLNLPTRSSKPVEVEARTIIMLAFVLGLGAGLILALVVQAIKRERAGAGA